MNTQESQLIRKQVEEWLSNKDLEIELEELNGEYSIVYSTNILAQDSDDLSQLTRNYWVNQKNGGQITAPWGSYEYEKQRSLVSNLLIFAKYKIKNINKGWRITCGKCNHMQEGPIWRTSPKSCEKCGSQISLQNREKILAS